jgi:hypothetical protein
MPIRGKDRYENLLPGAPRDAKGELIEATTVRFGGYVVPRRVAWILEPVGGSPGVRAEFEMRRTGPACVAVSVTAQEGGRSITTADLATLPGLDRKALDAFTDRATMLSTEPDYQPEETIEAAIHRKSANLFPDRRRVRGTLEGHTDDELRQIADVYRHNMDAPVQAVHDAMGGEPVVSRRTVDRRIREARDRGFLPPTTRGRKKA